MAVTEKQFYGSIINIKKKNDTIVMSPYQRKTMIGSSDDTVAAIAERKEDIMDSSSSPPPACTTTIESSRRERRCSIGSNNNDNNSITQQQRGEIYNFVWMSVLFGGNHGCVLSCLSLATSQLGSVGAWQSGILYLAYTASGLFGSAFIVKSLGSRNALMAGMAVFCAYVGCFWVLATAAASTSGGDWKATSLAYAGAVIGGFGGGLIWVAQGVYYCESAELHAREQQQRLREEKNRGFSSSDSTDLDTDDNTDLDDTDNDSTATDNTTTGNGNNDNNNGTTSALPTFANTTTTTTTATTAINNTANNNNGNHSYEMIPQQEAQEEEEIEQQQGDCYDDDDGTLLLSKANSLFAAIFAFVCLAEEVALKALSSFLLHKRNFSWAQVFAMYTLVAVLTTILMLTVRKDNNASSNSNSNNNNNNNTATTTTNHSDTTTTNNDNHNNNKVLAAWNLLLHDPKMKYMIGFNAVFGLTSAFLNSYVNGEVVQTVLEDKDVGILSSWVPAMAAVMSLVFHKGIGGGKKTTTTKNGFVLTTGILSFVMVVVPFMVLPPPPPSSNAAAAALSWSSTRTNNTVWGWSLLLLVFTFQGIGRATFESTIKATFADFFPNEKEGAFANIIIQNGLSSTLGYVLTIRLSCAPRNDEDCYCVRYRDGTYHDVLSFEWLVVLSGIIGIAGYWRASYLHHYSTALPSFLLPPPSSSSSFSSE